MSGQQVSRKMGLGFSHLCLCFLSQGVSDCPQALSNPSNTLSCSLLKCGFSCTEGHSHVLWAHVTGPDAILTGLGSLLNTGSCIWRVLTPLCENKEGSHVVYIHVSNLFFPLISETAVSRISVTSSPRVQCCCGCSDLSSRKQISRKQMFLFSQLTLSSVGLTALDEMHRQSLFRV